MDCRVVVEAAVPVYDVETADEAVRIAISKTGGMLNPDLSYVEIDVGSRTSPSGEALEPAFIVADEALVALELTMTVFNVEREEHASRIARKEIGQRMQDIPLDVLEVSVLEEEDDGDDEATANGSSEDEEATGEAGSGDGSDGREEREAEERREEGAEADDDDILPEFEDLIDE
ncbi:hypothetical protein BRC86_03570 [Halobacteriales archaeon QS_3_64_16]|nr:MAG: hypothetical protein BRC86_03570 [Halobacteriales archaeon QS_3_64_16]